MKDGEIFSRDLKNHIIKPIIFFLFNLPLLCSLLLYFIAFPSMAYFSAICISLSRSISFSLFAEQTVHVWALDPQNFISRPLKTPLFDIVLLITFPIAHFFL